MNKKSKLGQFYTTNYEYILQKMYIPNHINHIIEPFVGNGDLINFIKNKDDYIIEKYDIEPKIKNTIKRDTLINPPTYKNKFVLTNPPYLARNKNVNKEIYERYKCNDLYKCFIKSIINDVCEGGIIIVPLNFICSIRKSDIELRKMFLEKYEIVRLNIFEEKVFNDTTYSVCSIQFSKCKNELKNKYIETFIFPLNKNLKIELNKENNYTIGGEIYTLPINKNIIVERATSITFNKDNITNILLKCIDDNIDNKICLKIVKDEDIFIDKTPKLSARSYATLVITPKIDKEIEKKLVNEFNLLLNENREKYNSLFLTNYRESNNIARKRISFDLAFKICNYLLTKLLHHS